MARKTIKVDNLARVEGEGGLTVVIRDNRVQSAELRIFEPPRFFPLGFFADFVALRVIESSRIRREIALRMIRHAVARGEVPKSQI